MFSKQLCFFVALTGLLMVASGENESSPSNHTEKPKTEKPTTEATKSRVEAPLVSDDQLPELNFNVTEEKNKSVACIRASFGAELQFIYTDVHNKSRSEHVALNGSSVASGDCKTGLLVIDINGEDKGRTLTLKFARTNSSYSLEKVSVLIESKDINETIPDTGIEKGNIDVSYNASISVSNGKSYYCQSETTMQMRPNEKSVKGIQVVLLLKEIHLDAYRETTDPAFRDAEECSVDGKNSDFTPIIVGVALAALVVIVLIGYFIGRNRSRRLAYQSV